MDFRLHVAATALVLVLGSSAMAAQAAGVFDLRTYGVKPNSDITRALSDAWKAACDTVGSSRVVVPKRTYHLGKISLSGPCKGPIELHVKGTLKAPMNPATLGDSWVSFQYLDWFTLSGRGAFDGQGKIAWTQNDCRKKKYCSQLAVDLAVAGVSKRPTCCVLVQTKPNKGVLAQEDQDKLKAEYAEVVAEVSELTTTLF